jgi:hypothetical protein
MTTHRRSITVDLFPGEYEQQLVSLMQEAEDALRREVMAGGLRFGQKSAAAKAAEAFDALRDAPPEPLHSVRVWQVGYLDWDDLVEQHPARKDNPTDALHGVNMNTFPRDLLHLALVDPSDAADLADRIKAGKKMLRDLSPSREHYLKLEAAAWSVNNEALNLPKESLASLLTQKRGDDSEPQHEPG